MYRDLEQLRTQAHVSVPLLPKSEIAMNNLSSNKDCSLKVPLSVPHCSKTLDDNVSSINVSNIENQKSEAKIDRKSEASEASVLNDKEQEKDTYRIEESHATESSHKDHESGRDQYNTEAHTKVQEDVYEVKFVRCNCATCNLIQMTRLLINNFIIARGKKRSSIQSSRNSGIAERRTAG